MTSDPISEIMKLYKQSGMDHEEFLRSQNCISCNSPYSFHLDWSRDCVMEFKGKRVWMCYPCLEQKKEVERKAGAEWIESKMT